MAISILIAAGGIFVSSEVFCTPDSTQTSKVTEHTEGDTNEVAETDSIPPSSDFFAVDKEPGVESLLDLMKLIVYPKECLKKKIQGIVTATVYIDEYGIPRKCEVLATENEKLNQAAIDALMKYRGYIPAEIAGETVGCWMVMPINFRVN
jgi:outer membrane biosynthesis protein TonB